MNVQQCNTQNTQVAAQQQEVTKCGINGVFTLGGKFAACASHGGGDNTCFHKAACDHKQKE